MKERPILVSGPLVRPIQTDHKTQTRRIIRAPRGEGWMPWAILQDPLRFSWERKENLMRKTHDQICPYGQPGDRLWVRESWRSVGWRPENGHWIEYAADNAKVWREAPKDVLSVDVYNHAHPDRWRPSIHMPRWASRLSLEVTEVRAQRIQDITEEDARAEGLPLNWVGEAAGWTPEKSGWLTPAGHAESEECCEGGTIGGEPAVVFSAREALQLWWDHINGERAGGSWKANPWVSAVSFKRVQG